MGWTTDETGEHEGYVVAYVPRDWTAHPTAIALRGERPVAALDPAYARSTAPLRELGTHAVDHMMIVHGLRVVGAACTCGWRSPRQLSEPPLEWFPSCLNEPAFDSGSPLVTLWSEHVEHELERR
jgi:hypothetical protein